MIRPSVRHAIPILLALAAVLALPALVGPAGGQTGQQPGGVPGMSAAPGAAAAVAARVRAGAAEPAASPWVGDEPSRVRLVSGTTAVGTGETVPLGLQFDLDPGWKVYWRTPGPGGLPPQIDWSGSDNLAEARLAWPAPHRFDFQGIESFGYEGGVIYPVQARLAAAGGPLALRAAVDYLTCREICIPVQASLALDLPAGPAAPSAHAAPLAEWVARVPGAGGGQGLALDRVRIETGAAPRLVASVRAEAALLRPDLFVETTLPLEFGRPEVTRAGEWVRLAVPVHGDPNDVARLAGSDVTLTLVDGARAAEQVLSVGTGDGAAPAGTAGIGAVALILATALLGGLILNLMPCVLPVLSLKLLGVVEAGGQARGEIRRGFLAAAAGIVVSFLVLAAGAIALQAAGGAVGWGIQFQQPWFLALMTLVVVLFAANLWGWFEIPLPAALAGLAGSGRRGLAGHFATGAFAALLATPCSAPFVGTALGFALSRGPAEIVAIFLALGLGLALPYLAVAAAPGLARLMPRPGRWMMAVRRVLALALVLTAAWLLSVLAVQGGTATALALALLLAAGVLLLGPLARLAPLARGALAVAVVIAFALGVAPRLGPSAPAPGGPGPAAVADAAWRPFERAAIAGLVGAGRTVFVDVTADWCITCQVNKKLVLDREAVRARLDGEGVVAMRADWTRPDPGIAAYLAAHGRYGIPFNVVYGPGAPDGIILSELLTESAVLDALDRAGVRAVAGERPAGG